MTTTLTKKDVETIAETIKNVTIDSLLTYVGDDFTEIKEEIKEEIKKETKEEANEEKDVIIESKPLEELINELKNHKNVGKEWWKEYNRKIKSGDIVYIPDIKKFGIFVNPSTKENKVRIRLLKNHNKNQTYTTDWLFNINEIEVVKHNNKLNKHFTEDELQFKIK